MVQTSLLLLEGSRIVTDLLPETIVHVPSCYAISLSLVWSVLLLSFFGTFLAPSTTFCSDFSLLCEDIHTLSHLGKSP